MGNSLLSMAQTREKLSGYFLHFLIDASDFGETIDRDGRSPGVYADTIEIRPTHGTAVLSLGELAANGPLQRYT